MDEKKYEVIDCFNNIIASNMTLEMALLLMKAYCQEYYNECIKALTIREIGICKVSERRDS